MFLNASANSLPTSQTSLLPFLKTAISVGPAIPCSLLKTVIVSANDELVKLYLNKKIKYQEISKKIIKLIKFKEFQKLKKIEANKVTAIEKIHKYVRLKINSKSV